MCSLGHDKRVNRKAPAIQWMTVILGGLGLLLYVLGVAAFLVLSSQPIQPLYPCAMEWSGIDGARFRASYHTAWTADERYFRFDITRGAYWQCERTDTYVADLVKREMRLLSQEDDLVWSSEEEGYGADVHTSPSGKIQVTLSSFFWYAEDFSITVFYADEGRTYELSDGGLIRALEARARRGCTPSECRTGGDPILMPQLILASLVSIPIALAMMVPALWARRERRWAKIGLWIAAIQLSLILGLITFIFIG